ncbi:SHOCT domain-containing protein [Aliifodinibius sp. S!AR15-10]|uniref:SHOCT domain-containing protein n=1 Tax=Aliifodinibius sp. S!AR15-10 TaxID=2950437 RepID=UPI00285BC58F|nr:SHOCT domain-containing protein [Aliifodinibius sp. S!AR15-10]MDR8391438.1 SHOCT domain-containing protein [Aliifodinibius sp. S!AR15-10]
MHDFNFFGGGWMMFVWWFIIIVLVIIAIRALINSNQNKQNNKTPMEILKRRYANGEIDEEEFHRRKQELQK